MATLLRRFVRTEEEPATARNLRSITGLHRLQFRRYPAKPAKSSDSAFISDGTLRSRSTSSTDYNQIRHCPYIIEAITSLAELGVQAKDIFSLLPQTPSRSGRPPFDQFESGRWLQRYVEAQCCIASNDYKGWSTFVNIRLFSLDNYSLDYSNMQFNMIQGKGEQLCVPPTQEDEDDDDGSKVDPIVSKANRELLRTHIFPRTPKPLTFSKNRLWGDKNRSITSPVANNRELLRTHIFPRTPKPLTFSKNRLWGDKNRSITSPVANVFFTKKRLFYFQTLCICEKKNCTCACFKFMFQKRSNT
ncbi:hypothetical protein LXL04_032850 [Taraxacum kok-saghyz]